MKNAEHLKNLLAARASKVARLEEIAAKAADENRNKDQAESEEFDTISDEIEAIDREVKDARRLEKFQVQRATRVAVGDDPDDSEIDAEGGAGAAGKGRKNAEGHLRTTLLTPKLAKGLLFARYVKCVGAALGSRDEALALAKLHYPDTPQIAEVIKGGLVGGSVAAIMKAAVGAGSTTDATWAAPLVAYNQFAGDFLEFLRPQTIIGKFGVGGVPDLRKVPFNVHIRGQTSGGSAGWVGQGAAKPVTKFDFSDIYLEWSKVASIAVLSEDLLRFSNPSAETLVRDALSGAIIQRLDTDFIDPTKTAVAHVSPASITNGAHTHVSSGGTADHVRADIRTVMQDFIFANISPSSLVWIMSNTVALQLSLLRNAFGQKEFPDITMMGGSLEGVPVITSQYASVDTAGGLLILASAQDIWLADDGQVTVDASREASLEMNTAPSGSSTTPTAAQLVSMFQTNSVALRAERFINWKLRRAAAVSYLTGVDYDGT